MPRSPRLPAESADHQRRERSPCTPIAGDPVALRAVLGEATWDAVIDTWSGPPRAVLESATVLAGRSGHYGYVSSRSVYQWPPAAGLDESGPVIMS